MHLPTMKPKALASNTTTTPPAPTPIQSPKGFPEMVGGLESTNQQNNEEVSWTEAGKNSWNA